MQKIIFLFFYFLFFINSYSQNKSGYTWIYGDKGMYMKFAGDTSSPSIGLYSSTPLYNTYPSNMCDSATGKLLFMCNGFILYDTLGNIIENGDSLVPFVSYTEPTYPVSGSPQNSLILPKGSNGLYYVFTNTITDSMYNYWITNPLGDGRFPFNLLQYHIVDANANGGLGKVIQKNIPLLQHVELNKTGMQACRHANGYDWWLLKQGADSNAIYTFLVKADTILGPYIQKFPTPVFGYYDLAGQSTFSNDGTKYAFCSGGTKIGGAKLFIADFDRCWGKLSNIKEIKVPIDLSLTVLDTIYGPYFDSAITGIAFSPNDSFLYINRMFNIYQYDLYETDGSQAFYHVQYGIDTAVFLQFVEYGNLHLGIDDRIYIGNWNSSNATPHSYINKPNQKGAACGMCRKCLPVIAPGTIGSVSFPNMPNFNLGALSPCWPDEIASTNTRYTFKVYPNPANKLLNIEVQQELLDKKMVIKNIYGQLVNTFKAKIFLSLDISNYPKGIYFISINNSTKKVIIE